jgi:hypothetical protein
MTCIKWKLAVFLLPVELSSVSFPNLWENKY